MMSETRKTLALVGAAAVFVVLALVTAPHNRVPEAFFDAGEKFFPDFTDPNAARTLEVIDYDASTGSAVPFKVTFSGGVWTIPSADGYPADGKDRLAQTAAGLIDIKRDDFRTDNPADFAACGVIDPLDESNPSIEGRGKRVTIKGENDVVLADIIVGKPVEGVEDFFLVRLPEQKRVYATHMKLDISTQFKDWIESDLMMIEKDEIDQVVLKDYSVDEGTGRLATRDEVVLNREADAWNAKAMKSDEQVNMSALGRLLQAVDELSIEGVRPKPAGLSRTLSKGGETQITQEDMLSLQSRGFYFTSDGRLVSNEGELRVRTKDGVTYTLRFGEVAMGEDAQAGMATVAGTAGENRYLMITTSFDASRFPEPARPTNLDFQSKPDSLWTEQDHEMKAIQAKWDRWKQNIDAGSDRSTELNDRFARWYYVISADSFDKLHLKRADVLEKKA